MRLMVQTFLALGFHKRINPIQINLSILNQCFIIILRKFLGLILLCFLQLQILFITFLLLRHHLFTLSFQFFMIFLDLFQFHQNREQLPFLQVFIQAHLGDLKALKSVDFFLPISSLNIYMI